MTASKSRAKLTKEYAAKRLALVFHPLWCSVDDCLLMTARAACENFTAGANRLGRPRIAVEQRYHRLRAIRGVMHLLEDFGLTTRPYEMKSKPAKTAPQTAKGEGLAP